MSNRSLPKISGSMAIMLVGLSITACSPTFTDARDPFMGPATPSVVDKKPFALSCSPMAPADTAVPASTSVAIPQPAQQPDMPFIEPVTITGAGPQYPSGN